MVPHQEEKSRDENELPGGLLTVGEAPQRLRISEHTLRRWINQRSYPREVGAAHLVLLRTWITSLNPAP